MPLSAQFVQQPEFDYDTLAACHRKAIEAEVVAIRGLLRQTAESIVQIGLRLQIVHDLLGRHHFQEWLEVEFGWSQSTASRYMRVAAQFAELSCIKQFQPSALYLLAQKRFSEPVRNAAISLAEAGQIVTRTVVEQLLRDNGRSTIHGKRPLSDNVRNYLVRITENAEPDFIDELAEMLLQMVRELRQRGRKS